MQVKCNNCGWRGDEADLIQVEDIDNPEATIEACPDCQHTTDLENVEEDNFISY
jgi:hypothetical protein